MAFGDDGRLGKIASMNIGQIDERVPGDAAFCLFSASR